VQIRLFASLEIPTTHSRILEAANMKALATFIVQTVNQIHSTVAATMVYFWIATASIAVKLERLRSAEKALLDLAVQRSSKCQSMSTNATVITTIDTIIPASVISSSNAVSATTITATSPCSTTTTGSAACDALNVRQQPTLHRDEDDCLVIHAIEVTSDAPGSSQHDKPLVLLHGYSKYSLGSTIGIEIAAPADFLTV
jgi:hypothetical protein